MKKNVTRIIVDVLCWVLVAFLAGAACILLVSKVQNKVPYFLGNAVVNIKTGSMEPTIMTGEYIQLQKIDPKQVKAGDVICFYSTDPAIYGMLNTHRVVSVSDVNGTPTFTTKGDNNVLEDAYPVTGDRVAGIFVRCLPGFTAVMHFLLQKFVLFLLILVPVLLLLVPVFREALKTKRQKEYDRLLEEEVQRLKQENKNPEEPK